MSFREALVARLWETVYDVRIVYEDHEGLNLVKNSKNIYFLILLIFADSKIEQLIMKFMFNVVLRLLKLFYCIEHLLGTFFIHLSKSSSLTIHCTSIKRFIVFYSVLKSIFNASSLC